MTVRPALSIVPRETSVEPKTSRKPSSIPAASAGMNIDWSVVVTNLRGGGMSARGIARRCFMEPPTVSRLQSGEQAEPRWTQALALLDLHHALCPEKHRLEELRA